ncbi:MAG: glycosyltransferase family 1 protein [Chloroflexota bacterium]|nr:MAG: glycosyltransferase family 1 protein [Chloroflexota bacterium]
MTNKTKRDPLRVLMLSWEYPPHNVGGLGKHVTELAPALVKQGVEVRILTPRWVGGMGEEVLVDGSTIYRVEPPQVDMPDFFTGAWRTNLSLEQKGNEIFGQSGTFDIIHAHDWLVAFAAIALKHAHKTPLLATIHATEYGRSRGYLGGEMQRAIHNVEWWLTFEAWRVICCSQFMRAEISQTVNTPWDKIDIIANGVDASIFDGASAAELQEFRKKFALPNEKIVFHVGRLVQEKGVHILVESIPHVLRQFPMAKFVIAGTGGMLPELKIRAEQLGVSNKVFFTGFIPDEDRNRLFQVADVAVFPSLYEPFGIVALEAMAARTPVVVSSVGGFAEIVQNNETGMVVYPDSVESLTWGITHTLARPDWAQARADNAYRMVLRDYSWDEIARRTREVYERIRDERERTAW